MIVSFAGRSILCYEFHAGTYAFLIILLSTAIDPSTQCSLGKNEVLLHVSYTDYRLTGRLQITLVGLAVHEVGMDCIVHALVASWVESGICIP